MSIYFDFEVGPKGRRFRKAVDSDKYDIQLIVDSEYEKLFGIIDIGRLIEITTLSICMINAEKEVVGFLVLDDRPCVPSVDPADWENWIRNMFQKYYLSRNTLFVCYFCCVDSVKDVFLEEGLMTAFDNDLYLKQIVLTVPPHCPEELLMQHSVMKKKRNVHKFFAKRLEENEPHNECHRCMYTFSRCDFCPRLKMRRAVEEDNDDIVNILDKTCPRLRDLYGDYYVSELIGRHPESTRQIIVAQHQDRAVAVMCLNEDINYKQLASTYELRPYYGLRKATPLEKEHEKRTNSLFATFGEPILKGQWSPFHMNHRFEKLLQENTSNGDNMDQPRRSKVNFGSRVMRKSLDHIIYRSQQQSDDYSDKMFDSPDHSRGTVYSISDLLDEDPFDYEIVNIDYELLNVPELPVYSAKKHAARQKQEETMNRGRRQSICKKPHKTDSLDSFDYGGEPNAFTVEILGVHEDYNDRILFDLLEAAVEMMKNYDYCIIRTPCAEKPFRLLEHFCYVPTKPAICSKHALYIAHRASILGKLRVKEAELADVPSIAKLLKNLDGKETLWTVQHSIHNRAQNHRAYVFLSGLSVVGVGILEPPEQIDFIRAKFNIDSYHNQKYHYREQGINAGFATIKMVQIYSVFEPHYRFFAREMMRLSGSTTLLWLTAYRNKWEMHKANVMTSAMIPLVPRKSEVDCTVIHELRSIGYISQQITAFSTWYISRKFTSVPKIDVNTRILVVGASRTAMSFLNTLLFDDASTYLNFTNVTLVSPDGLPYIRHSKVNAELMFPRYRTNTDMYLKSVPYTYYVNVLQGTMIDINRKDHYITLRNGAKYYYDKLFLLLGKQYQHPNYLREINERERQRKSGYIPPYVRLDVPRDNPDLPITTDTLPLNVFVVNTVAIANRALNYVKSVSYDSVMKDLHVPRDNPDLPITTDTLPLNVFVVNTVAIANRALNYVKSVSYDSVMKEKIIVYGASIHAYCCIAALLEARVAPDNIVLVEPFPPESRHKLRVPVFNNANVDQTIRDVFANMNLTVYRSYQFQSWSCDACGLVKRVDFLSHYHMLRLDCSVLFYYGLRGISAPALEAINKSGLVYDGGILIDHEFKTKDPCIYAAGTATRYYRRYYADTFRQKYYDAQEIGEKLGKQIRNQLDPYFSDVKQNKRKSSVNFCDNIRNLSANTQRLSGNSVRSLKSFESTRSESAEAPDERIPFLKKPVVTSCVLPGGLRYLEVRSPGLKLPNHYVQTLQYSGHVMETIKRGYFKIHLNNHLVVDGITCLSSEKYSLENFQHIYGLPASVLNNVYLRYTAKKLDDFYEFFRSPWAFFLYHDQCDDLFAMAKELRPKGQRNGATLQENLMGIGDRELNDSSLLFHTKLRFRSKFEHSALMESITDYVIEWLSENDVLLPMYVYPGQLLYFRQDLAANPAFRRRKANIVKLLKTIL